MSFDKKEYQRAYMRKKREKNLSGVVESITAPESHARADRSGGSAPPAQSNLPADVLPEPEKRQPEKSLSDGEARHSNCKNEGLSTSNVAAGKIPYDKKKYPNKGAWEIAVQRTERVISYARKFPNLTRPNELQYDKILDWQYQNEGIKASCK